MPSPETPPPRSLLQRYLVDLRIDNWSPRTIDRRVYSLGRFIKWSEERGIESVADITPEIVESYRRGLYHYRNEKSGKPLRFATQASYLRALRHWMQWLVAQQWLESDPTAEMRLPKDEHRLPAAYLTLEEAETLLGSVDLTTPAGFGTGRSWRRSIRPRCDGRS